jgi:hypothetical protein
VAAEWSPAVFLVRAWYEEGRLYARIRSSSDVTGPETEHLSVDPEDVVRRLRAWLNDLDPPASAPNY